jgi:hypothetical protein
VTFVQLRLVAFGQAAFVVGCARALTELGIDHSEVKVVIAAGIASVTASMNAFLTKR